MSSRSVKALLIKNLQIEQKVKKLKNVREKRYGPSKKEEKNCKMSSKIVTSLLKKS